MAGVTGTLEIVTPSRETEYVTWNGLPEERDEARRRFEELVKTGSFLAAAWESPGRATQVRTFDEVEALEKARGQIHVTVSPSLAGG